MKNWHFVITIFILCSFQFVFSHHAFAQQNDRNCPTGYACFKQGDYLKYYETLDGKPFVYLNYTCFLELGCNGTPSPDANPAQFAQPMMVGNWEYDLDLTKGCNWSDVLKKCWNPSQTFLQVYPNTGIVTNEWILEPVPIEVNHWIENKFSVTDGVYNYKGMDKQVIIFTRDTDKYVIGKETGILFYSESFSYGSRAVNTLIDTNISTQQPKQPTKQNTEQTYSQSNQVQSQIPSWIKNNAKWWSEGSVADNDFVKGMQYLIQQGIIKVPQTQQSTTHSQQIPSWVKNNAGWWAQNQISNDEFLKGIQYLINNGIISP